MVQSGSRPRTFVHNSLSQLTSATNPESGAISYAYDSDGNLLTKTDARGITTTFAYDGLHRLTQKTYSDSTPAATFTYDVASVDGLSIQYPVGRLVKAATANTRAVNSYDNLGRVATQWQCTPANCGTGWHSSTYQYNELSGVTSQTNPMGFTLTQAWNSAAVLTALTSSWADAQHPGALATVNTYHAGGAVTQMTLGNGLVETRQFNPRGQPTELRTYYPSTGADTLKLTYGFIDANGKNNGNVMAWSATASQTFSRSYTYDELNRLKTMASTGACTGLSWSYDIWGNRTQQTVTGGSCGQSQLTINTLNRIADPGFQYDAAGNLTAEPGRSFQYDAENRLITINGGTVATYTYDASGQRVRKVAGSTTTDYIYDVAGHKVAEWRGGAWQEGYVYFGGQMLAHYGNGTTYFQHRDHLGSARVVTQVNRTVLSSHDYLPYGEGPSAGPDLFTGKDRDGESGLDYFGARYYSSGYGRFLSPDPMALSEKLLENPQDLNLYAYTINNPLRYADPDGEDWKDIVAGAAEGAFYLVKNNAQAALTNVVLGPTALILSSVDTVQQVATAVSDYSSDGVSGTLDKLAGQGEQGAMAVVTEGVLTGGLAASSRVTSIRPMSGVQVNRAAGLNFESQVLKSKGLPKNTTPIQAVDPKTGQPGATIPDAIRPNGQTVDAKGGRTVSDSAQLRRQSQASQQAGQKAQVVVKKGTKVSKTVRDRMDVKEQ